MDRDVEPCCPHCGLCAPRGIARGTVRLTSARPGCQQRSRTTCGGERESIGSQRRDADRHAARAQRRRRYVDLQVAGVRERRGGVEPPQRDHLAGVAVRVGRLVAERPVGGPLHADRAPGPGPVAPRAADPRAHAVTAADRRPAVRAGAAGPRRPRAAYAILRHNGVDVGKIDFIGPLRILSPPADSLMSNDLPVFDHKFRPRPG